MMTHRLQRRLLVPPLLLLIIVPLASSFSPFPSPEQTVSSSSLLFLLPAAPVSSSSRRSVLSTVSLLLPWSIRLEPTIAIAADDSATALQDNIQTNIPVQISITGDAKQLFNEGRALESQGNLAAARRLYEKVTRIAPRFIYGWSNLGNTQTAFGELQQAEESYSTAIQLCRESLQQSNAEDAGTPAFGVPRCADLYVLLLNRGTVRLNRNDNDDISESEAARSQRIQQALEDLQQSSTLRGRPDAIILQNLARAEELTGRYAAADRDYTLAITMTSNQVNPFWLRSALVKFQLGDVQAGLDLLKRVEVRFPEAPEVRAARATFYEAKGDATAAQQTFLEIPDKQRLKFSDQAYLTRTIAWPPAMIDVLSKITKAVGDR